MSNLVHDRRGSRTSWEYFRAPDADFTLLVRELVQTARAERMRLVSLDTPVASSVQKFANLTLSTHLVTPDYELLDRAFEKMPWLCVYLQKTFELTGPPAEITIKEASTAGKMGDEVAVCNRLFPVPYGTWQSDYFAMGLRIPAPYTIPVTEVRCSHESIEAAPHPTGKVGSRTLIRNSRSDSGRTQRGVQCAAAPRL